MQIWRLLLGVHASSLDHHNGIMQTVLTVRAHLEPPSAPRSSPCYSTQLATPHPYPKPNPKQIAGSYICFYVAEAIFAASGVMAVVTMGMFLCMTFWTVSADQNVFNGTWHALEWCFNTVLFQMAGLIIADQFINGYRRDNANTKGCYALFEAARALDDGKSDLLRVYDPKILEMIGEGILLYLFALLIRSIIVALFFPLLQRLGYGITWQGAVVATWGGLRGAVGLALAIVMQSELKYKSSSLDPVEAERMQLDGMRIMIFVALTALFTLLINATTTGPIVRRLGLTAIPKVELKP